MPRQSNPEAPIPSAGGMEVAQLTESSPIPPPRQSNQNQESCERDTGEVEIINDAYQATSDVSDRIKVSTSASFLVRGLSGSCSRPLRSGWTDLSGYGILWCDVLHTSSAVDCLHPS